MEVFFLVGKDGVDGRQGGRKEGRSEDRNQRRKKGRKARDSDRVA